MSKRIGKPQIKKIDGGYTVLNYRDPNWYGGLFVTDHFAEPLTLAQAKAAVKKSGVLDRKIKKMGDVEQFGLAFDPQYL